MMFGAILETLGFRVPETRSAPVFDGELRPNQELDLCRLVGRDLGDVDDVAVASDGTPLVSAGRRILAVTGHWFAPQISTAAKLDGRCGALCALTDGGLAVAVDGTRIAIIGGKNAGRQLDEAAGQRFTAITAMAAQGSRLVIAEGSSTNGVDAWRRDLFEANTSGRVVEIDLATGRDSVIASGLAWASGVAITADGGVVYCEAWAHRVTRHDSTGSTVALYKDIPAYPGRLSPAPNGHFWLSCFAARTQLVDFVLADRNFTRRMMAELPEAFWIAPALAATDHPFEPTQLGGVKQYGAKKPWAPPRSYGLVVRLGQDLGPVGSMHSRVDGKRHGITGVAASDRRTFFLSRGHQKLMLHEEVA